ncbi:MAG TPA: DinB family protein [Chitinophaga sp.]|uniref:DinB family protein n=1 Tax=Chitinophaga sp. TaxID=1869181 RepID=UPI002D17EBE1|nr:DinB family protein [Chitinophaga sp.]HVI45712.1 DinB family protein [Chitinophaga sp.]
MEIKTVDTFIDYFGKIRKRTSKVIQVIPPDQLEWTYKPGKFTLGDQVRHIVAIERYMYGETVAGRPSAYQGCGKDLADGYDNVISYFNEMHRQSMEIFSSLRDEDLQRECLAPGDGKIITWKWLRAMIEHEIHHRAQIYTYLGIIGVPTPPIFGLTSEEVISKSVKL